MKRNLVQAHVVSGTPAPAISGESVGEGGRSAPSGERIDSLLQEASMLMKSLRSYVEAVTLKKAAAQELSTGLLDGGATNALRVGSALELAQAVEVNVGLAAGSKLLWQDVQTGTLLSMDMVEPIVPLRGLISLGYKIRWDSQGCTILHPQKGKIRCWLRNGCPVVTESSALSLMSYRTQRNSNA